MCIVCIFISLYVLERESTKYSAAAFHCAAMLFAGNLFQEDKQGEKSTKAQQWYFTRSRDQNIPKYGCNVHNIPKYRKSVAHYFTERFQCGTNCNKYGHTVAKYGHNALQCGKVWTHFGRILQRRRAEKVNPVDDKFKVEGSREDREWLDIKKECFIRALPKLPQTWMENNQQ